MKIISKQITLFLIPFVFCNLFLTKSRTIDIYDEIKNAILVEEVIFKSYDTIKVSEYSKSYQRILTDKKTGKEYNDTNYVDSVWVLNKVHYISTDSLHKKIETKVYCLHSWSKYYSRPNLLPRQLCCGYWPKINDTCLLVVDKKGATSFLGLYQHGKYIFWDPNLNTSYITFFIFDPPFDYYYKPPSKLEARETSYMGNYTNRKFTSLNTCCIKKTDFWNLFKKQE
ncbi:MAG TPA: hypothetical protein VKG26_13750 [Bacteroidia bacterium]|nr:hypothetical protein [Bacteroidia bacterium]